MLNDNEIFFNFKYKGNESKFYNSLWSRKSYYRFSYPPLKVYYKNDNVDNLLLFNVRDISEKHSFRFIDFIWQLIANRYYTYASSGIVNCYIFLLRTVIVRYFQFYSLNWDVLLLAFTLLTILFTEGYFLTNFELILLVPPVISELLSKENLFDPFSVLALVGFYIYTD